ncbi:uncharacterized protein [Apostichopus japonicus]|uniref:uncharacterized protein isoform X2 n=1 Tax=Stichopus japonicus TaxID=307972 RepID=UPI003AB39B3F
MRDLDGLVDSSTTSEQPGLSRKYETYNEYQSTNTEASLHYVVNKGCIERLSGAISRNWREVGRKLEISDEDLDILQSDTTGGHKEKVYQMLNKWKQQNGGNATYKRLGDALESSGRKDLQQWLEQEAKALSRRSTVPTNQSVSFWATKNYRLRRFMTLEQRIERLYEKLVKHFTRFTALMQKRSATKNYGLRRFTTLEQRIESLYEKLVKQFTRITALMQKPSSLENNLKNNRFSHSRINKNERFFRRNNIRIVGFTTKDGENCLEIANE